MRIGSAGLTRGPATGTAVNLIVRKMERYNVERFDRDISGL